ENAGDAAAVAVGLTGVAGVEAGAARRRVARLQVTGEARRIEIHVALDHADADRLAFAGCRTRRKMPAIEIHRVEEAVGRPLGVLPARAARFGFAALGAGLLDHH